MRLFGRRFLSLAENNDDAKADRNGESRWLRELLVAHAASADGAKRPFVAIDGGANQGEYTRLLVDMARRVDCAIEVHAFEPSHFSAEHLRAAFSGCPAVHVVGAALADRDGETFLFGGKGGSTQASLILRDSQSGAKTDAESVPVTRLDHYLDQHALKTVDLLKLDVEGSELAALRGLGEWLDPNVIDAIQFEYGGTTLEAGVTLRDLYRLLESRGYVLGKLFPRAVEIRPYRDWMEHFSYANFVALAPRWVNRDDV